MSKNIRLVLSGGTVVSVRGVEAIIAPGGNGKYGFAYGRFVFPEVESGTFTIGFGGLTSEAIDMVELDHGAIQQAIEELHDSVLSGKVTAEVDGRTVTILIKCEALSFPWVKRLVITPTPSSIVVNEATPFTSGEIYEV